jgi:3-oxoacyl-[acyl-carrier protein] reductase
MPAQTLLHKTVIVTGAARGLGRCMALAAADAGAMVVAVARESPELDELRRTARGTVMAVAADVTDEAACRSVIDAARARFGKIDGLINNAAVGMNVVQGPDPRALPRFWEVPPEIWHTVLSTNVIGAFRMARLVAPHMVARGYGRILNVTTSLRTMVRAGYAPYGPSKAALEAATAIWAKELTGTGVTVNAVLPGGAVNTRMISDREGLPRASLLPPESIVPPALWLISRSPSDFTGMRLVARNWRADWPEDEAARSCATAIEEPFSSV